MSGPRGSMDPDFEPLGKKVEYPELEHPEYVEAPDIGPYYWRHTKTGKLKYAPPTPPIWPTFYGICPSS